VVFVALVTVGVRPARLQTPAPPNIRELYSKAEHMIPMRDGVKVFTIIPDMKCAGGTIVTAKAPSTPDDFSEGVMSSLRLAGEGLGLTAEALLADTARLALGTTVGTNAMPQRMIPLVSSAATGIFTRTSAATWSARWWPSARAPRSPSD
jgi:hypothetical protein